MPLSSWASHEASDLAVRPVGLGTSAMRLHLFAQAERDALLPHEVLERLGDLAVEEAEHLVAALDQRDTHAERRHDARVLDADYTAADDDHRLGHAVEVQHLVAGEDVLAVEWNMGRTGRARSDGDQEPVGLDQVFVAVRAVHDELVGIDELGAAPDQVDIVPLKLAAQVAATLRTEFPNLRLMISVALKSPGSARAQTIEANIGPLIDLVDVVGISAYPYVFFDHADKGDPGNLPANWFSQIQSIANGKPIAVAETAWIAERLEVPAFGVDVMASTQDQADYMDELFAEAEAADAEFVVWWALVDFDPLWNGVLAQDPVARIWRDTGLFDESLNQRPALDTWQRQLALQK